MFHPRILRVEGRRGEVRAEQGRAEQSGVGEMRGEESRAEQSRAEWSDVEERRGEEGRGSRAE